MTIRTITLALLAITAAVSRADLTVDPGVTEVFSGTPSVDIPLAVIGGDQVSDLAGAIKITGAQITGVSYTGSIWESAPGGFIDLGFIGFPPPAETIDPNVSMVIPGQTVSGAGTLLTFTVDTSSLPAGDYPIKLSGITGMSGTPPLDTKIVTTGGEEITTNLLDGILRVVDKPLHVWRTEEFPGAVGNSSLEASVWGDAADPDGDGVPNLLEFAFDLSPSNPDLSGTEAMSPGLPTPLFVEEGGETYFAVRYTRRIDRTCHTTIVETSTDLETWDPSGANLVQVGTAAPHAGGLMETVTERLTSAVGSRMQLRVVVTNLAP